MERNINCRILEKTATVKNNFNKYEAFKTALNLDLIHIPTNCPDSEYSALELKFLQVRNGRVDKQDLGPVQTKDIADCIAEVSATLLGGTASDVIGLHDSRLQVGAQYGYNVGRERDFESFYKNTRRSPQSPTRSMGHRNQRKLS